MTEERGDPFAATGNRYADYAVYDDAGDEIGKVEDLFVDENGNPDHLGVKTSFLGPKTTFIPMDTARVDVRRLVEFSGSKERGADAILDYGETTPELGRRFRSFFGVASDEALEAFSADWIAPFLLVCLRDGDRYGHELTRRMIDLGFGARRSGAMYRALRQMEKEGMIFSEPDGFDRALSQRRCSITEFGEAYLECLADAFARYQKDTDLFLRAYNEQHVPESRGRSTRASG